MAQTQNENALGSCNPSDMENLLYFSYLPEDDDDAQPASKMVKRELKEFSKIPPPLGLRLTITPSLVQLIEAKLNGADEARAPSQELPSKVEKLKAVHLPMRSLMIGFYLIEAQHPAHLVAKFYFAKRKLVWEILDKGLKHKVEIQWKNISAIRASIEENKPGNLEIELDRVPSFFHETTPQPRKHTVWTTSPDFTGGYASKYRRHSLRFPPGVLNQHYLKLLQLDKRLLKLSRTPFPSFQSGYFDSYLDEGITHIHFGHDLHARGSRTTPASEQPILDPPLHGNAMPLSSSAISDPTSLSSACEQQPTFVLPLISTQQVQLYDNTTPLSTSAINKSTPLSSGICSPTNEAINNQLFQDPRLVCAMYEDPLDFQRCSFYQLITSLYKQQ